MRASVSATIRKIAPIIPLSGSNWRWSGPNTSLTPCGTTSPTNPINPLRLTARAVIPAEFYPNTASSADVESIGVKATFVTSTSLDENIVYAITKEVFDNLDEFKKLHPAYAVLNRENMLQGLSAPIHKGALRYYKEAGLVKYINPELIQ